MKESQESLADEFYAALPRKLLTIENKRTKASVAKCTKTELIYSCDICLLNTDQISLEDLFNYKLVPVLTSLFTGPSEARCPKGKSTLKEKLKVEVSTRKHDADDLILNGCAVLYHLHWPKDACAEDFVGAFIEYVIKDFQVASRYLTFDRYRDYGNKGQTRPERLVQYPRTHTMTMDTPF